MEVIVMQGYTKREVIMEGYTNDTFKIMSEDIQKHFEMEMWRHKLFKVDVDTDMLWNLYLDSYPEEMQSIYKENRWQDCTACRRWFRKMANVVALDDDGNMITMFSCNTLPQYQSILDKLEKQILDKDIKEAFLSSTNEIGVPVTYVRNIKIGKIKSDETEIKSDEIERHNHFFSKLPDKVIYEGVKVGQEKDKLYTARQLLERSLDEISLTALDTVLDLIEDNNLYRGQQWENQLKLFRGLKISYADVTDDKKNNWLWLKSMQVGRTVAGIKNHSIGVLLNDLSDGVDIEIALKRYEQVVAPSNYQRPKAIFTQKMLDDAKEKITELGYLDSLSRRYAKMDDVSINDVLFANRNLSSGLKDTDDLFSELEKDTVVKHQSFDFVEAIDINDFIENVLPKAKEVSLYNEALLSSKFVSLIAPVNADAPSMFKWDNPFSWVYKNNISDSMKEQVKALGGDVDVDLRFTIRWNNGHEWDRNDLDAHCIEPNGNTIFFGDTTSSLTGGWLDVDIIHPNEGTPAVENIQYKTRERMSYGEYLFRVHQYNYRGGDEGFEAEIEFDGNIYSFNYPFKLSQNEKVAVAKVVLHKDGTFELISLLDNTVSNRSIWNVKLNEFIPVTFICYSPNYWGNNQVGNQHVFFMLQDCQNDDRPNAWFNEYLNSELREHRQVMEALGTKARVEESENQLSGIGFSLTQHAKFKVKVLVDDTEKIYQVMI